jgi:hypothetical protein
MIYSHLLGEWAVYLREASRKLGSNSDSLSCFLQRRSRRVMNNAIAAIRQAADAKAEASGRLLSERNNPCGDMSEC